MGEIEYDYVAPKYNLKTYSDTYYKQNRELILERRKIQYEKKKQANIGK